MSDANRKFKVHSQCEDAMSVQHTWQQWALTQMMLHQAVYPHQISTSKSIRNNLKPKLTFARNVLLLKTLRLLFLPKKIEHLPPAAVDLEFGASLAAWDFGH